MAVLSNGTNGTIASIGIENPGAGYSVPPMSTINGVKVGEAQIILGGIGYGAAPTVQIASPESVGSGNAFGLTVAAEDEFGNVVPTYSTPINVGTSTGLAANGPLNNQTGSTLSGQTTVVPVNGVATFSGLSLNKSGTDFALEATSGTLVDAQTSPFNVTPGAASQVVVTVQPPPVVIGRYGVQHDRLGRGCQRKRGPQLQRTRDALPAGQ